MRKFDRTEILDRLQQRVATGNAIIAVSAGIGIVGKLADRSNADLIIADSSGPARMEAQSSALGALPVANANQVTLDLVRRLAESVHSTPIIAGVGFQDPSVPIDRVLGEVLHRGASGLTNLPSAAVYGRTLTDRLADLGYGTSLEAEMIGRCHESDVFTLAVATDAASAALFADAGADVVAALPIRERFDSIVDVIEASKRIRDSARAARPDVLVLAAGGHFHRKEAVAQIVRESGLQGYLGFAATEKDPFYAGLVQIGHDLKALTLRETATIPAGEVRKLK